MSGTNWVLLVAGSKGWSNYRHQANVCAAYQIIKRHGIPDEQIVVMMYDDIATNEKNPIPGNILSVADTSNVYPLVPHDYTKEMLTPKNFLSALKGDDNTGRKVIRSEKYDNIFIYMSGLGRQGKFDFLDKSLSATDLNTAINNMYDNKKYSKMVIYMDSDFSESMFTDLSESKDVYAVTSCDTKNSNKSIEYDSERKTYLSDQFSAAWLNFMSMADFQSTTFSKMFEIIKKKAETCPCEKGDKAGISKLQISEFLGKGSCSDCQ